MEIDPPDRNNNNWVTGLPGSTQRLIERINNRRADQLRQEALDSKDPAEQRKNLARAEIIRERKP